MEQSNVAEHLTSREPFQAREVVEPSSVSTLDTFKEVPSTSKSAFNKQVKLHF